MLVSLQWHSMSATVHLLEARLAHLDTLLLGLDLTTDPFKITVNHSTDQLMLCQSGQTHSLTEPDPLTANLTMVTLIVDTIIEFLLAITDDLIVPSIPVIELFLVEGLLKEDQVLWTAAITIEVNKEIMMTVRCGSLLEKQGAHHFVDLHNGSQETPGITVSALTTEAILYRLLWSPEEHRRVQVCPKIMLPTNVICRHQDIRG